MHLGIAGTRPSSGRSSSLFDTRLYDEGLDLIEQFTDLFTVSVDTHQAGLRVDWFGATRCILPNPAEVSASVSVNSS